MKTVGRKRNRNFKKQTIRLAVTFLTVMIFGFTCRYLVPCAEIAGIAPPESLPAASESLSSVISESSIVTDTQSAADTTQTGNSITITKKTQGTGLKKVTYFIADVRLKDIRELKTCFAHDSYGLNITERTSAMAKRCNAKFAVNGDYYGTRNDGIIIRNGKLYRDVPARAGAAFLNDGNMITYDEAGTGGGVLNSQGAWNTFSFGPVLVENGTVMDGLTKTYCVDTTTIENRQPRTAVGEIAPDHFVFVVVDGRRKGYSCGMTFTELAALMLNLGCKTAYNLDGGSSATMYYNGKVVNRPCSMNKERYVSDCIYIN